MAFNRIDIVEHKGNNGMDEKTILTIQIKSLERRQTHTIVIKEFALWKEAKDWAYWLKEIFDRVNKTPKNGWVRGFRL